MSSKSKNRSGVNAVSLIILIILLIVPSIAISRLTAWVDWRVLLSGPIALSLVSFLLYRSDKRRAETGAWRIPESTLHLVEVLGGWPGAFLAQRIFRHKIAKASFQFIFWSVILIHELIAADALLDWRFTHPVIHHLKSIVG